MFSLAKNIKFRMVKDKFQNQMKNNINIIKKTKSIFVKADKTNNYCKISKDE